MKPPTTRSERRRAQARKRRQANPAYDNARQALDKLRRDAQDREDRRHRTMVRDAALRDAIQRIRSHPLWTEPQPWERREIP